MPTTLTYYLPGSNERFASPACRSKELTGMQKVLVMYKLRPDVTLDQYISWSKQIDQRITPGQAGITRFEVYAVEHVEGPDNAQYEVVEDIEVESWDAFQQCVDGPGMAYVQETFPLYADESTVVTICGNRVVADLESGARPPLPADAPTS
jgi:hypothetical protein